MGETVPRNCSAYLRSVGFFQCVKRCPTRLAMIGDKHKANARQWNSRGFPLAHVGRQFADIERVEIWYRCLRCKAVFLDCPPRAGSVPGRKTPELTVLSCAGRGQGLYCLLDLSLLTREPSRFTTPGRAPDRGRPLQEDA